jgi:hypothetical protein
LHYAVLPKVNAQARDAAVLLFKAIWCAECMELVVAQRLKKALPGLPWQTPHTGEKPELFD